MSKERLPIYKPNDPLWILATIVSRVFEPVVVLTIVTLLGAIHAGLSEVQLVRFALVFLIGMVVPPVGLLIWKLKTREISNWDVSRRKERVKPLMFLLLLIIIDEFIVRSFGNTILNNLFLVYLLWVLGFFAVTTFWKISGHAGVSTLGVLLFIQWYGWEYWPLLFIPLAVIWARLYRHDHTLGQLIVGFLYSAGVVLLLRF